ncbi:hypothetical protein [Cerasicoccus frondis]|uniref:HzsA-related protein n=1 Tax=Cerasicoccus frondis TaxID=490090 RepID=UPI0028526EA6|nr:hypothetical protein [Cerasicoccus frondis]
MFLAIRQPLATAASLLAASLLSAQTNPIVFVTQVPQPADFTTIGSTFGNHRATMFSAPRGGDLWIRYADGDLKNLTEAAGYGEQTEHQGATAIAVRDPSVSWDGQSVIFSMIVGAPYKQYDYTEFRWQLYEITGLGKFDTPVITKVANQPEDYNNISPVYGTDGRIIFTTDRPRGGEAHLYPQLDEYEEAPTVTGLWSLDPATGDLFLMEHAPSGSFSPMIDSYGRVIFTRWDHLQRDQQADGDELNGNPGGIYGTFDFSDESADAEWLFDTRVEYFPEPRAQRTDLLAGTNLNGNRFNHFFPWMIEEDGTEMETLNHIGRHELHQYFNTAINDDPALTEFIAPNGRTNPNSVENMFMIEESPVTPGLFIGVDAPEFDTHSGGLIFSLNGAPTDNPDDMLVTYLTHPDTGNTSNEPSDDHSGLYRDPLPTSDGLLIAAHTSETRGDSNEGSGGALVSRYDFRIKVLGVASNGYYEPTSELTGGGGIVETHTWWSPDSLMSYTGPLWELQPVELRARAIPDRDPIELPDQEAQLIAGVGESLQNLKSYLRSQGLAMVVMRDVTTRDDADEQQPYWLRVHGDENPIPEAGSDKIYDVKYLQFFQGDQVRGIGMTSEDDTNIRQGRRVLARPMRVSNQLNRTDAGAPPGSVLIGADGSAVAVVPARRALSWQLTDAAGEGVVRERYWLSFQPGEVRSCTSCHGLNRLDHAAATTPQNIPAAMDEILTAWVESPPVDAEIASMPLPEGGYRIYIRGYQGQQVVLQRSTNLSEWDDVETIILADDSDVYDIPAEDVPAPTVFYRLARPASVE